MTYFSFDGETGFCSTAENQECPYPGYPDNAKNPRPGDDDPPEVVTCEMYEGVYPFLR